MRRHASAASLRSTSSRPVGSIVRGTFATRGGSGDGEGSGAPATGRASSRLLTPLCLAIVSLLGLCASPALAAETHPFVGSFGPDGVGGTESFNAVRSIAVDPASGATYVYDSGAEKIYKFDSSGAPLNFSATGTNAITGVGGGGGGSEYEIALAPAGSPGGTAGDIYVANNGGAVHVYSAAGTQIGEIEQGGETCGVATDPSGNLYVGIYSHTVKKFTPSANPPTVADETGTANVEHGICNVAADGLGNVYAANFSNGLFKLEGLSDTEASLVDFAASTMGIAPGSNDVYADRGNAIYQYDSSGNPVGSFANGEISGSHGIAVNSGATKIYVGAQTKVRVYGPTAVVPDTTTEAATAVTKATATLHGTIGAAGGPGATCVFQYATASQYSSEGFEGASEAPCSPAGPFTGTSTTAVTGSATGLAGETTYYFRLVGSNENGSNAGETLSFATPEAVNVATAPATGIGDATATLNGTVNPEGTELEQCRFEYGESTGYGKTVPCAESPAEIGAGNGFVPVHADLTGLSGGTGYHFRLVGKNEFGTSYGADEAFKTPAPTIESESIVGVTLTSAIFKAQINPNGEETTYRFQYVSEAEYEASGFSSATELPAGGEGIGSATTAVEVEQEATGLSPRTTYHLRVVAENEGGVTTGPELVFTTFSESSSGLPDGRVYEQATPVDKDGGNAQGEHNEVRTSPEGNGISFIVNGGIPGAEGGQNISTFLSLRGPSGWSTQGLMPAAKYGTVARVEGLSEDLSVEYVGASFPSIENSTFEKDTATKQYTKIYQSPNQFRYSVASEYLASSANSEQALIRVNEALNPGDAEFGYPNLYVWDRASGQFIRAAQFNNGEVPEEGFIDGGWDWFYTGGGIFNEWYAQEEHIISADGSHVFFGEEASGQLYMRVNPTQPQSAMSGGECTEAAKACTYRISESQRSTPDPEGTRRAKFLAANADGSRVFFMSGEKLTDDSTATPASNELYSYDTETHTLTDLTPEAGADVNGMLGMSRDGSSVYFSAGGVLASGGTEGDCQQGDSGNSVDGSCNIYLWREGAPEPISFVAHQDHPLSGNVAPSDSGTGSPHLSRVSQDGKTLIFSSSDNLTSYDSHGSIELYRYREGAGPIVCISCPPSGEPPSGGATLSSITPGFLAPQTFNKINTRNLSADGNRLFFESGDKLVNADTNGVKDVYEWEAEGTGSCASHDQNGGCLFLISTGTSPQPTFFGDSSESGDDAYIFTTQPLVGQDKDELVDIYDARVDGGFAYQNPPPPSICTGESCRPPASQPPATESPGTSTFTGPGNPTPKKHHKKKHHHRKHHKKKHRSAKRQQGSIR